MVIDGDDRIDGRYLDVHQGILSLLARQSAGRQRPAPGRGAAPHDHAHRAHRRPVREHRQAGAADGRAARRARTRSWRRSRRPANQARDQIKQAQVAFEQRNLNLAENLVSQDDVIDRAEPPGLPRGGRDRRRRPHAREWAAHVMLIARYLERIGDHTVDIGEQIAFVISGEFREFTDASRPGGTRRVSRRP